MKKGKKNTVRPKTAGRKAPAALRLEVGKTYETRDGKHRAEITHVTASSYWPFHGKWIGAKPRKGIDRCTVPYWSEDGRIYSEDSDEITDLVREVRGAKRPQAAAAKGSR